MYLKYDSLKLNSDKWFLSNKIVFIFGKLKVDKIVSQPDGDFTSEPYEDE